MPERMPTIKKTGIANAQNAIRAAIGTPTPDRLRMVAQALRLGMSPEEVHEGCKIDPWFTDTYLLGKNETARIAFVADNPGVWMFHCHVIDHMETGLMAAIEVV